MLMQLNIYDAMDRKEDPVFRTLSSLNKNNEVQIGNFCVRKSEKYYEIENDELHEIFKSIDRCYTFISHYLV